MKNLYGRSIALSFTSMPPNSLSSNSIPTFSNEELRVYNPILLSPPPFPHTKSTPALISIKIKFIIKNKPLDKRHHFQFHTVVPSLFVSKLQILHKAFLRLFYAVLATVDQDACHIIIIGKHVTQYNSSNKWKFKMNTQINSNFQNI